MPSYDPDPQWRTRYGGPSGSILQRAPVTIFLFAVAVLIFFSLAAQPAGVPMASLSRFGYLTSQDVWEGKVWGLVTNTAVHFAPMHLLMNLGALWAFGTLLEPAIGSYRFLAFYLAAAVVSSSLQLAVGDSMGVGMSGVIYAMFGFMWFTRDRYPEFLMIVHDRTVRLLLIWLVGCMVVTYLDIISIGNMAHFSGMIFGIVVAKAFVQYDQRWLYRCGLAVLVAEAIFPIFYAPWSPTWLGMHAYQAHIAKDYERALNYYTQMIEREPTESWAYSNRAALYAEQGDWIRFAADMQKVKQLDGDGEFAEP